MKALNFKLTLIAITAAISLSSCTASYQHQDISGSVTSSQHLMTGKVLYIATPADGAYGAHIYSGSGRFLAQQVAAAFAPFSSKVTISPSFNNDRQAIIEEAKGIKADYLIIPVISHWEHRATEWSGLPSRVSVAISVISVNSGKELRASLLESRSRIMSWTGTSPESLLPGLLKPYAVELYGAQG